MYAYRMGGDTVAKAIVLSPWILLFILMIFMLK